MSYPISGSLYYMDKSFDRERIGRELDAQRAAGFDLVWVNGPLFRLADLKLRAASDEQAAFDPIACLMEEAHHRRMTVMLEIMAGEDWYERWDLPADLETSYELISLIGERYGQHPSFFGYYLGNEIYIVHGAQREYCKTLWTNLARCCKQATPGCKVALSPFFVTDIAEVLGYTYEKPEAYANFWESMLTGTDIDILMLQDSGAEHASCFPLDDREPYFAAVARACSAAGVELWGNVELAEITVSNYEELKAFRSDFGVNGVGFHDPRWVQVPLSKLRDKAGLAERYCSRLVSWGFQQFVSPLSGKSGAEAYYEQFQTWNTSRIAK